MAERDTNARATVDQVKDVISTTLTDGQINAFINTAHRMVQNRLSGKGLSEETLGEIEVWLAAHFLSARDQRKKQVKADDVAVTYQGETGMGLQSTVYGQQAMILDPTNTLASTSQKRATFHME
jgi:hypothetical protein